MVHLRPRHDRAADDDVVHVSVRVTGPSPDDEEWLVGESLDGSRSGGFPRVIAANICDSQDVEANVGDCRNSLKSSI